MSCIESPSHTNTNSVVSPQDIQSQGMVKNVEEEAPEGSVFNKGTPIDERGPSLDLNSGNSNIDIFNCQKTNAILSEIYFIMQQNNKSFKDRMVEVIDFSTKNCEGN